MKRTWQQIPRDNKRAQWSGIYVTMNKKGTIVMNREAWYRLQGPKAMLIFYDGTTNTVGLKPAAKDSRNAFPLLKSGRHGGMKIAAYRLLMECQIRVEDTLEFHDAEIDANGILLLNLRTAKISNRALNHPSRRRVEEGTTKIHEKN